jgi:hypothetical protein
MIYLAGPYTSGGPDVRRARFDAVTYIASEYVAEGKIVFSPLTMTHPMDIFLLEKGAADLGSAFWVKFDEAFMSFCTDIHVVKLPGWEVSSGVNREIAYFLARGIDPTFVDPRAYSFICNDHRFKPALDFD